jgi:hypothetical protein
MKIKLTINNKQISTIITMNRIKLKRIIIQGITETGEIFKPSDWAERVSGKLCTFENHRIIYSPLLHPLVSEGHKCISIDPKLKNFYPDLYRSILHFAKTNKLKICADGSGLDDEYK